MSDGGLAIGLLEVLGLTAAIGAADAMAKAAPVELVGPFVIGGGLVTVVACGDIAAVTEAVEAGAVTAERLGQTVARDIIGRPFAEVLGVFGFQREVMPTNDLT